MKRILVPTDLSPNANKALDFAVEIARSANAALTIIYVNTLVETPFRTKTALEKKYNLPFLESVQQELEAISTNIRETTHIDTSIQIYGGTVVSSIEEAVEETKADMIVMGTLGDSGFKEKLIGSVTASIIGKSNVPVLAVPLLSEWTEPRNILLAVNHFDENPGNAKPVFEMARLFYSKVTVAVFTDQDKAVAVDYIENSRGILSYEQELESMYKDTRVEPGRLYGHHFDDSIDEYIKLNEVDLLAMFTHKRGLVENIIHKSMTKKMSYHTNIPLLSIPVL